MLIYNPSTKQTITKLTHIRNVIICPGFQARKVIKKKAHSQNKKKENTADTAHLLNRMGVRVPVHAFQSSICVCVRACVYCLGAGMDDAILLHL